MDTLYAFSTALLQARQRINKTQEQVAWAIGVSHATYNAWECGHRICPYKHIIALISYFDDDIFTRRMLRILLSLQHNMAGLSGKSKAEISSFYIKLVSLLEEEYTEWLNSFE